MCYCTDALKMKYKTLGAIAFHIKFAKINNYIDVNYYFHCYSPFIYVGLLSLIITRIL